MEKGGVTQSVPAEGGADAGWGSDPREWSRTLRQTIQERFDRCSLFDLAAGGRKQAPLWCHDGVVNDFLRMQQAWAERGGAMPNPRPLVFPPLSYTSPEHAFEQFMQALGADGDVLRVDLPSGDVVQVSDDLFRALDGRWKITKRGRDQWLIYLAELIKQPQEIWRIKLAQTEELYLLGRFQRGKQRVDAIAVFKRDASSGVWGDAKTSYTFDDPKGIDKKRAEIIKSGSLVWLEV